MLPRTEEQLSRFKHKDAEGLFEWENFRKHGQGCRRADRPHQFYPIWLAPNGKLKLPKMEYDKKGKQWNTLELLPSGWVEMWPMKGREQRVWLWSHENFEKHPQLFKHEIVRGEHIIYKKAPAKSGRRCAKYYVDRHEVFGKRAWFGHDRKNLRQHRTV